MKKLLLSFSILFIFNLSFGQIINGDFEDWSSTSWLNPDSATRSSLSEVLGQGAAANVTRSTDKQHGTYSIKLENVALNNGDTAFGYFIYGDIQEGPQSGIPFTQKPDSVHGYYKSGLMAGDTGMVIVMFWQNDTVRSEDFYSFVGSQAVWTQFDMELNISTSTVDSVTFAAVSANPFNGSTPHPGSWLMLDNIWFGGSGVTQNIPNHSFENWSNLSVETPDSWFNYNIDLRASINDVHVEKATPAYKGSFAAKLTSFWVDSNRTISITNADYRNNNSNNPNGGSAFSNQVDTICGWYKYTPMGTDTASVGLGFSKNDTIFDWQGTWLLSAASYTYFEIPFNLSKAPDTVIIQISSSSNNYIGGTSGVGSVLIIDELQFKSAPLNTGINNVSKNRFGTFLYPNPACDFIKVEYELSGNPANVRFAVYDVAGREVFASFYTNPASGKNTILLNTSSFASGIYSYKLISGNESFSTGVFTVEK